MSGVEPTVGTMAAPLVLEQIEQACEAGQYLQAHGLAQALAPLDDWPGAKGLCLAGRLAQSLGAPQHARRLRLRAFRRHPSDPVARSHYLRTVAEMRGPLLAWERCENLPEATSADPQSWADLFITRARLAAQMRDFETAERWLAEAELRTPGRPWVAVERAGALELQNRCSDALATAQAALNRHPCNPPAVETTARLLQLLERKAEALELLESACARIESGSVAGQLATLQMELGHYAAAMESFTRCLMLCPLAEDETNQWLLARRADAAYFAKRYHVAASFARQVESPFYREFTARLEQAGSQTQRVLLPVKFERHDPSAGARATLSAISAFWQKPAQHLESAEANCCDGTSAHSERQWAEEHGWAAREFQLTWNSALALVDRGAPFTLSMPGATTDHLQVVAGYDALRQTLLVLDPGSPEVREVPVAPLLNHYASSGPRGMVLVPRERAEVLQGLELPEAALYDRVHSLFLALERDDRPPAAKNLDELRQTHPDHRLTFAAQRLLAGYDADATETRAATRGLLALYPDDERLQWMRLSQMRDRADRIELLTELCSGFSAHPLFLVELAGELSHDARTEARAAAILRRAARFEDLQGRSALLLGDILWRRREYERGWELYRCAAGLDEGSEVPARSCFIAGRHLRKTAEVLAFLTERFRRRGAKSNLPARTLFWAHEQLDQMTAAFLTLEAATEKRPEDGDLKLFAADAYARYGNFTRAQALLDEATGQVPPPAWSRARARLARTEGGLDRALGIWKEIFESEPTALDANTEVVELLAQIQGTAAALRHLRLACARFPHHLGLYELWWRWMRQESARDAEPVIQRALTINPANAWAHRELALNLSQQGLDKSALESARAALHLEPNSSHAHGVLAAVLANAGRNQESHAAAREAIRLSVDNRHAIEQLIRTADSAAMPEALAFVVEELIRQPVRSEGMLEFRDLARGVLEPEALLAALKQALAVRPDLWRAWCAVILQLLDLQRLDESFALAVEAAGRFPLVSAVWWHRSRVCHARLDDAGELEALQTALEMDPADSVVADHLASAHERRGDLARARSVLEATCIRAAFNPQAHLHLARILWRLEQREEAIAQLRRTIKNEPRHEPAWTVLREWAGVMEKPELPMQVVLEITEERPGDPQGWLVFAEMLAAEGNVQGALDHVARAIRLQPRLVEAYDLKVRLLVSLKQKQEAIETCYAKAWEGRVPVQLCGRAAWVEAELGSLPAAVKSLNEALADHPDHYRGWQMLADWTLRLGDVDGAMHAVARMALLAPRSPVPLGLRARLKLQRQDRAGAKADLQQALKLDLAYEQGAAMLFDLLLEDQDLGAATDLLALIKRHVVGPLAATCEARLNAERARESAPVTAVPTEARSPESQAALKAFRVLCLSNLEGTGPLDGAFRALLRGPSGAQADALLEELLQSPNASPFVGAFWARRRVVWKGFGLRDELNALLKRGEIGRKAIVTYIGELAAHSLADPLHHLIEEHKTWLVRDQEGWEAVGVALRTLRLDNEFFEWMRDWRERTDFGPELRLGLVCALRNQGRDQEADEVARTASSSVSANPASHCLQVWVAVEAAIAGESERGQRALQGVDAKLLDDFHRQIHRFARSLLEVQCAEPGARGFAGRSAMEQMNRAAHTANSRQADTAMRRTFRRSMKRLARDCHRPSLRLWSW